MTRRALLWLVPLFIAVHNIEEAAFMPGFLAALPEKIPGWLARRLPAGVFPPTYHQYIVMLLVVTLLPYILALLGGSRRPRAPRTLLLAATQMVMLLNVLSHVGSMNLLNSYVPGLVTSLAIMLPFSLYFFATGLRQGWLYGSDFLYLAPIAVVLHGPGLVGLIWLARLG